jgi:hypothetical protein
MKDLPPANNVKILKKIFAGKKLAKKLAALTHTKDKLCEYLTPIFSPKIVENWDHNIDPRDQCKDF